MTVRLDNGVEVLIRRIRPEDKPLLAEGMARLSPESVHRRFLTSKATLTGAELRYLTELDPDEHVAYVAVLADDPAVLVAVARWVRMRERPEVAEIAFVVGDELQGQGLGTAMAEALAASAREHGVERVVATMLADNAAARRLFAHVAPHPAVTAADGVYELAGELRPAA